MSRQKLQDLVNCIVSNNAFRIYHEFDGGIEKLVLTLKAPITTATDDIIPKF